MNPAHEIEKLPAERRIIYISAILGIVLFIAFLVSRKSAPAPAVSGSQGLEPADPTNGNEPGAAAYDPTAAINAAKEVSLASIAHQAALKFSIASNSLSHDLGLHSTSGSGSGGLSIGPFSIGGGGSKSGLDQWDLTTSNDFSGGFEGSGLSEDEFQLLIESGAMLANKARESQDANNTAAQTKADRYKPPAAPANAPNGKHLERAIDGHYYWVANAR